jgi:hypothetical protein
MKIVQKTQNVMKFTVRPFNHSPVRYFSMLSSTGTKLGRINLKKSTTFSKLTYKFGGFPEETIHSLYELRKTVQVMKKPIEPSDEDCCGTGCVPCVFDAYEEKKAKYKVWLAKQEAEAKKSSATA